MKNTGFGGEITGHQPRNYNRQCCKKISVSTPLWWIFKTCHVKLQSLILVTIDSHSARVSSAWKQRAGVTNTF